MILRSHLNRLAGRPNGIQCLIHSTSRALAFQQVIVRHRTFTDEVAQKLASELGNRDHVNREDGSSFLDQYKCSYRVPRSDVVITKSVATELIDTEISIQGHLMSRKDISSKLFFVPLVGVGKHGHIQIVSRADENSSIDSPHNRLKKIRPNSAVSITGTLKWKQSANEQSRLKAITSAFAQVEDLELSLTDAVCLNEFPSDIIVSADARFPPEQRHLQIMYDDKLSTRLRLRSNVARALRHQLRWWQEIETPILFKSTPEGAREFLVPTRRPGFAYALPQSPQQYKQILMASGIGKYYQFAKCFRDEDLRADRQPEFTQLDLELAFADGETVMNAVEDLIRCIKRERSKIPYFPHAKDTFPRMSYQQAMDGYGSDKPDLRITHLINRVETIIPQSLIGMLTSLKDPLVEVVKMPISSDPDTTMKFVQEFMDSPEGKASQQNPDGAPGIFVYDSRKPIQGLHAFGFEGAEKLLEIYQNQKEEIKDGDLFIVQARPDAPHSGGNTALGRLRLAIRHAASSSELMGLLPKHHRFLWVVDFPMFTPNDGIDPGQGGSSGFKATHHPFTAPRTEKDIDLLLTDPLAARADHYDLVVNGVELGGGSRRIHNVEVQKFIMRDILKMSEERMNEFSHLFEALRAGCPPHAGFALGFDRLVAVLSWTDSVRDVIAFPKSGKGEDLFVRSPSQMTPEQQATYHLKVTE